MSKGPGSENYRLNNTINESYALSLLERNIGRKEHYNVSILTTRHPCTCGRHDGNTIWIYNQTNKQNNGRQNTKLLYNFFSKKLGLIPDAPSGKYSLSPYTRRDVHMYKDGV
jgi:hypothetical protein